MRLHRSSNDWPSGAESVHARQRGSGAAAALVAAATRRDYYFWAIPPGNIIWRKIITCINLSHIYVNWNKKNY